MTDKKKEIFDKLKSLLKKYERTLVAKVDKEGNYQLYSFHEVKMSGRTCNGMFFAGVMLHKGHVGFYFMPNYSHPKNFTNITDDLKKLLKGKSCFHIKELDSSLEKKITRLLNDGFKLYKKEGWV
jgi:hypothetical protein